MIFFFNVYIFPTCTYFTRTSDLFCTLVTFGIGERQNFVGFCRIFAENFLIFCSYKQQAEGGRTALMHGILRLEGKLTSHKKISDRTNSKKSWC